MACPHGLGSKPSTCSQCLGAPARKVELAEDGAIMIDGMPAGKSKMGNPTIQEVHGAAPRIAKHRRGLLQRCSRCGELGHKSNGCHGVPLPDDEDGNPAPVETN